jgi:SNW domain-containing protein 1
MAPRGTEAHSKSQFSAALLSLTPTIPPTMLASILPQPRHVPIVESVEDEAEGSSAPQTSVIPIGPSIPAYGNRAGWKPRKQDDFGNGGSYPECHLAQYPLEMGRKKAGKSGSALALQVDGDGNVRYDAIVHQGRRDGQKVQSQFKDMVPLRERGDDKDAARDMERPSEESIAATAERTRLALERITQGKIKSAQTKNVATTGGGDATYIRYTPGHQQGNDGTKQRIIKMTEQAEDPLAPPRWKMKKVPAGPPSPPAPVLRSPPRKVTAQEQKDWMIPPCISNWKNNKGFTIALDKRLAADGRGLQDVHINDGFAQFSEALNLADRHAREEVRQRSMMQQKLAAKEKAAKEDHLRQLAQRARDERSGIAMPDQSRLSDAPSGNGTGGGAGLGAALAGYGSDSDSDSESDDDDEAAKERDQLRQERRRERERDMRMSNMGTEQRAKMLAREENRDISEKVALGLAKKTDSSTQMDSRLFNQEKLAGTFGDDDSYGHFDKPLFQGSEAAAAMYRRPVGTGGADDIYTAEGAEESMKNDRFGLGKSKAFQGADLQEERTGPVQFEKDVSDPFAIDQFLDEAKRGTKRSGIEAASTSKRRRDGNDDD